MSSCLIASNILLFSCLKYESESESSSVLSDSLWPQDYTSMKFSRQDTRVSSLSLLQEIFPTQVSNPGLPHCRLILYQLSHKGSPRILEWAPYPFSRGSSQHRNRTRVSYITDGLFPNWVISLKYTMCPNPLVSTTISTYFTFECFLPPIISSQAH